jgi:hypothetical protein
MADRKQLDVLVAPELAEAIGPLRFTAASVSQVRDVYAGQPRRLSADSSR